MTSQIAKQILTIHILPNIFRSNGNQTMKYGQMKKNEIKHNMINTFLENSYAKCRGEASSRPFYKKPKFSISLDQQSEMLKSLLLLYVQVIVYQNKTKVLNKAFLKNKKKSGR